MSDEIQTLNLQPEEPENKEPVEVKRARHDEIQTEKNTPLQDYQPHESFVIKDLIDKARSEGYITVFLGSDKKTISRTDEIVGKWLAARSAAVMLRDEEITPAQAQARLTEWDELKEVQFPNTAEAEVNRMCADLFQFMENLRDDVNIRHKSMREDNVTNVLQRGEDFRTPLIIGRRPTGKHDNFSISQVMRRSAARSTNDFYQFDIDLPNSLIRITIKRPEVMEMGSLLQDIVKEIKGFVRTVKNNSVTLASIAGMRVIWRFIADRIIDCSVKDTTDYEKLADSILISDFDALCMGIVQSIYTRGVNMDLRCLHDGCDWADFKLTDPSKMVKIRHQTFTNEEFAIFGNVMNAVKRYSREELLKVTSKTTYGLETNRVYNKDESFYFEISPPSMTKAFLTFDHFAAKINPRIQQLRANILDEEEYQENLEVLLNSVNTSEYIHWISGYVVPVPPGGEGEPIIFRRTVENSDEFNSGLMEILNDDQEIGKRLISFIYNKAPLMSHTFTGVANFECPCCAQKSEDSDPRKLGYTPVNAFMTFFTLAQLKLLNHASNQNLAVEEAP